MSIRRRSYNNQKSSYCCRAAKLKASPFTNVSDSYSSVVSHAVYVEADSMAKCANFNLIVLAAIDSFIVSDYSPYSGTVFNRNCWLSMIKERRYAKIGT